MRDPLLLLDEVDKMGRDARGDPAAALLEVRRAWRPLVRCGWAADGAPWRPHGWGGRAVEGDARPLKGEPYVHVHFEPADDG